MITTFWGLQLATGRWSLRHLSLSCWLSKIFSTDENLMKSIADYSLSCCNSVASQSLLVAAHLRSTCVPFTLCSQPPTNSKWLVNKRNVVVFFGGCEKILLLVGEKQAICWSVANDWWWKICYWADISHEEFAEESLAAIDIYQWESIFWSPVTKRSIS